MGRYAGRHAQTYCKLVDEVPMKIVQDQVPLKIHLKSDSFENSLMEIPLLASATNNIKFDIYSGTSIKIFSVALEIQ